MPHLSVQTRAIVSRGPLNEDAWEIRDVALAPLGETELMVRISSVGLCHTDLSVGNTPAGPESPYPAVFGHEGAGIVLKTGSQVTTAKTGDRVLLSFSSCKSCHFCRGGHPAYCSAFPLLNLSFGKHPYTISNPDTTEQSVRGGFFGQSSFAETAIVSESSVVNVSEWVESEEEVKLFAPLGCGFQTGAGSVTNIARATEEDAVVVIGLGGVGMAAVMAAVANGVKNIIAVDRVEEKLELAKSMGATCAIQSTGNDGDLVKAVHQVTDNLGASVVIETTGHLMSLAIDLARNQARIVLVGLPPPGTKIELDVQRFIVSGKQIMGSMEGDVEPSVYIPQMIKWYRNGHFPVDRIVKFYQMEDFMQAVSDIKSGKTIKPILIW